MRLFINVIFNGFICVVINGFIFFDMSTVLNSASNKTQFAVECGGEYEGKC